MPVTGAGLLMKYVKRAAKWASSAFSRSQIARVISGIRAGVAGSLDSSFRTSRKRDICVPFWWWGSDTYMSIFATVVCSPPSLVRSFSGYVTSFTPTRSIAICRRSDVL
jgi:hypothetical protein